MDRSSGPPSGYENQTYTVEFTVPGSLDGLTLSPPIVVPDSDNEDPQQIYRPEVAGNLGLIDVDYVVEEGPERLGARGCRIVHVVWIESPVAGGVSARLSVVDNVDGTPTQQEIIAPLVGLTTFYRNRPFIVPQGSMLRIDGFTNLGPTPIKVRLTIELCEDMTEAQQAICTCEPTGVTGPTGPTGPDTHSDSYTFSVLAFTFGSESDVYFGFSSGIGGSTAGFSGSINPLSVLTLGAQKIICEESQAVCLFIHSLTTVAVDVFVEIDTGGGFVRSILFFAAVAPGGTTVLVGLSPMVLPVGASVRFGLRNAGDETNVAGMIAELQIVAPPP